MLFCSFFVCNSRKSISIKRKSLLRHLENTHIKNCLHALTNLAKMLIRISTIYNNDFAKDTIRGVANNHFVGLSGNNK